MNRMQKTSGWPSFWLTGQQPPWWARLLEGVYCALLALKRFAYRIGWLKTIYLPVPVIVVGNRVVGGTGKTPLLMALIPILQAQGWRVGIVSRGYGRRDQSIRAVNADSSSEQVGDEPLLLWQILQLPVWVGANRVKVAQELLAAETVDLIVSDDGWQHWALGRDYVIEVVDATKGYGNGHCLPAGPLREAQNALPLPDLTLYNGQDFRLKPVAWRNLVSAEILPLTAIQGEVNAMAGIGHPQRFFDSLTALGLTLKHSLALKDHQPVEQQQLARLDDGSRPLVMTAKDAVKCQGFAQAHWWSLEVATELNQDVWQPMIEQLTKTINERKGNG